MSQKKHLPMYGTGPLCVALMIIQFLIILFLDYKKLLVSGEIENFKALFLITGIILICLGIYMWIHAVIISKIDTSIIENHLLTSGIYAWVRNPIYSAFAIALTGISLLFANLWYLILPPLFWLTITVIMKLSEEKWLLNAFGNEYVEYCKNVNRCIPWFPKNKDRYH